MQNNIKTQFQFLSMVCSRNTTPLTVLKQIFVHSWIYRFRPPPMAKNKTIDGIIHEKTAKLLNSNIFINKQENLQIRNKIEKL